MTRQQQDRLFTPAFLALAAADLAYFTAVGVLLATTPLYVTGPLDGGEAAVGIAMGAFSATTLLLRPLAGRWADRHGRRQLMLGGTIAFTVVVAGHLLAQSLVVLVLLRLLLGAAEAFYFVAAFAALADIAPTARMGAALSFNSLALYAGVAIGPVIGQALLARGGFAAAWIGATLLAAGAVGCVTRIPETLHPSDVPTSTRWVHRESLLPGAALFTGIACMSGFFAFAVLRAQQVELRPWSLALVVFGLVVVGCRIAFANLPDRVAPARLATAALGTAAAGCLLLGAAGSVPGMLLGTVVLALGIAFLTPAVFALVFARAEPAERGSASATLSVFLDLGLGGGPLVVGLTAAAAGLGGGFVAIAGLAAVGAVLLALQWTPRPVVRSA